MSLSQRSVCKLNSYDTIRVHPIVCEGTSAIEDLLDCLVCVQCCVSCGRKGVVAGSGTSKHNSFNALATPFVKPADMTRAGFVCGGVWGEANVTFLVSFGLCPLLGLL